MAKYLAAIKLKRNGQTMTVEYSTPVESTPHSITRLLELAKVTSLTDFEDYEIYRMVGNKEMISVAQSHVHAPPKKPEVPNKTLTLVPKTPEPLVTTEAEYIPYTRESDT